MENATLTAAPPPPPPPGAAHNATASAASGQDGDGDTGWKVNVPSKPRTADPTSGLIIGIALLVLFVAIVVFVARNEQSCQRSVIISILVTDY